MPPCAPPVLKFVGARAPPPRFRRLCLLALILIGVAAGTIRTISIIDNNEILEILRDHDREDLPTSVKELQDLTNRSLGAAGWLIVVGVGVLVAEIVATIYTGDRQRPDYEAGYTNHCK